MSDIIALTMGDPAGIGAEIALRAWLRLRSSGPAFVMLDDPAHLRSLAAHLKLDVPVRVVASTAEARTSFPLALPVWPVPLAGAVTPGQPDVAHAPAVIASIRRATQLAIAGQVAAVVTNPISKSVLYRAGFTHPGHTEFLAALTGMERSVMMLANAHLRVVPVTIHVALHAALEQLTTAEILQTARITALALQRDFGLERPRLAVAGLNPHAGEDGAMGDEEARIIKPAIAALRAEGWQVVGPLPPDTMFTEQARADYDVAICMYHDQALIPLKTLDMAHGVNVTLGLPIIRTSPDHGTAFDIAGTGQADPQSLIAALQMAADMAVRRRA